MDQNQKERIELPKRLVRLSVGQIVTHAHFAHDTQSKKLSRYAQLSRRNTNTKAL